MAILQINNLSMIYQTEQAETKAIENVSFSVEKGQFVSIVGPSGCGKSTLLSCIAGPVSYTHLMLYSDDTSIDVIQGIENFNISFDIFSSARY